MSNASPGPVCPRCHRRIAAWKMNHCIYCGAPFPPDLKEGFAEPETLKWAERPALPPDAAKQLEMMKLVPLGTQRKPLLSSLSIPVFTMILYVVAGLIIVAGIGFLVYLAWSLKKAGKI